MSIDGTEVAREGRRADHCGYCGHAIETPGIAAERFGERFCSDAHAEEFAAGVREARIRAAAEGPAAPGDASMTSAQPAVCPASPAGGTLTGILRRSACWAAPLLLLAALPLLWTGSAWGAAGGSVLGLVAALACPIAMFFMMRAMTSGSHDPTRERARDADRTSAGARE